MAGEECEGSEGTLCLLQRQKELGIAMGFQQRGLQFLHMQYLSVAYCLDSKRIPKQSHKITLPILTILTCVGSCIQDIVQNRTLIKIKPVCNVSQSVWAACSM